MEKITEKLTGKSDRRSSEYFLAQNNRMEEERQEARAALYDEYGDHTDDAELAWSQEREYYDVEIAQLADASEAAGFPVHYDGGRWYSGEYNPSSQRR